MTIDELKEIAEIATPELIRVLELASKLEGVIPIKADRLVRQAEAAKTLGVNTTCISRYVREGILRPVYTPYNNQRKFWLSEVMEVASHEQFQEKDGA